jgi:hypothetical protein
MGRIEILYDAVDELAQVVLQNRIPLKEKIYDPISESILEEVSWPDSYIRYKEKVKSAEEDFGYEPLKDHQWRAVEMYLSAQYGLKLC